MKVFVKKAELELKNGGYLTSTETGKPVNHNGFVTAQRQAEYIVKFAEMAKGKTFEAGPVDCLMSLKAKVMEEISGKKEVKYIKSPKEVKNSND